MAFADYLDLRTAVIEQARNPDVADVFDRLTQLAEARFSRELRLSDQITTATLTFAGGVADLPADYISTIGLFDANQCEMTQQTSQYVHSASGYSHDFYAIEAGQILADGDAARTFKYFAKVPTITGVMTDTNWLLAKYPDVYLYGVGHEAVRYLRDAENLSVSRQLMDEALSDARADDNRARRSRTRVRVAGPTP